MSSNGTARRHGNARCCAREVKSRSQIGRRQGRRRGRCLAPSARDSAWDAAKAALEPTKRALQDSAVLLFRQMVERGAEERVVCPTPWAY